MTTSPMRIYLRRDELSGANVGLNRFLYVYVEDITPSFAPTPITPDLPGNDSSTVYGGNNSPNFGFNIGRQRLQLSVSGTCQPLDPTDFPDLPGLSVGAEAPIKSTQYYDYYSAAAPPVLSTSSSKPTLTGKQCKHALLFWAADQARSDVYANFRLGYGDWLVPDRYQEFKGYMTNLSFGKETAAEPDQFPYSYTFVVCDTIEVLT